LEWTIDSNCNQVQIRSDFFDTEGGYDYLWIDDQRYSGSVRIDQVVGQSAVISFSSNHIVNRSGFVLRWSCYAQQGTAGTISLENYENNQHLVWRVESDCHRVRILSTHFHTQPGHDYVQIDHQDYHGNYHTHNDHSYGYGDDYDGYHAEYHDHSGDADYWGVQNEVFSGIAPIDLVIGPSFNVIFSSDASITRTGFHLDWSCDVDQRGTFGVIELREYEPGHYRVWRVEAECDQVRITSTYFDTQHWSEIVTIDDQENDEFSEEYSGDDQLASGTVELDRVIGPFFTVRFTSWWTLSTSGTGFSLTWACFDGNECAAGMHNCDPNASCTNSEESYTCTCKKRFVGDGTKCNKVQTGIRGVIELADYGNSHTEEWRIDSDCNQVRIISTQFNTERNYDFLTIGHQSYHGSVNINQVFGQSVSLSFSSDRSVTRPGFVLTWSCNIQEGTAGTIELGKYENNHERIWTVESDCDQVRIISTYFSINDDYLTIGDQRYSGSVKIDQVVGQEVTVSFSSGGSIDSRFSLTWSCNIQRGTDGIIELKDYENNNDRLWVVESDCHQVRIVSTYFDTQHNYDYVIIDDHEGSGEFDSDSGYSGDDQLTAGNTEIDQVVGQKFNVSFLSDGSISGSGFVLEWSCDIQRGKTGTIELKPYKNDHDVVWMVESECDRVRIVSTYFDTQHWYDYVTIDTQEYHGDGDYSGDDQLTSGAVEIDQVVGPSFHVRFTSDGSVTSTGFSLFWSCQEVPYNFQWNGWTEWTNCAVPCGTNQSGTSERQRQCCADMDNSGEFNYCLQQCESCMKQCEGTDVDLRICDCVNPEWTTWEEWDDCLAACGHSAGRRRVRDCAAAGYIVTNKACNGYPFEYESCVNYDCGKFV